MTVAVPCGHMITICVLHSWLPTSRVNGEAGGKIANCGHVMSCLTTRGDLLNGRMGSDVVSLSWSHDVLLSNGVASPNCGH